MKNREHFIAPKGKIKWKCEHCLAIISADDKWADQEGSCPNCEESIIFPSIKARSRTYYSGIACIIICTLISFAAIKMKIPMRYPFPTEMFLGLILGGFVIGFVAALFNMLLKRPFIMSFLFSTGAGIILITIPQIIK